MVTVPRDGRLVVLGDPHGDVRGLDAVMLHERGPETVFVSAGDNVGYADGPTSSALCRRLAERSIASVRGNHEEWIDATGNLSVLAVKTAPRGLAEDAAHWSGSLPTRIGVEFAGESSLTVGLVHALRDDEDARWEHVTSANADLVADVEQRSVVFCGHSHRPAIYVIDTAGGVRVQELPEDEPELAVAIKPGRRYVVDSGSLGRPKIAGRGRPDLATYAFLDRVTQRIGVRAVTKSR